MDITRLLTTAFLHWTVIMWVFGHQSLHFKQFTMLNGRLIFGIPQLIGTFSGHKTAVYVHVE